MGGEDAYALCSDRVLTLAAQTHQSTVDTPTFLVLQSPCDHGVLAASNFHTPAESGQASAQHIVLASFGSMRSAMLSIETSSSTQTSFHRAPARSKDARICIARIVTFSIVYTSYRCSVFY